MIVNARFIDEQDGGRDRSASPNYHSLIYGKKPSEKEAGSNGAEVRSSCKRMCPAYHEAVGHDSMDFKIADNYS